MLSQFLQAILFKSDELSLDIINICQLLTHMSHLHIQNTIQIIILIAFWRILDLYCNMFYVVLHVKMVLELYLVQNAAAKLLTATSWKDFMTLALQQLW